MATHEIHTQEFSEAIEHLLQDAAISQIRVGQGNIAVDHISKGICATNVKCSQNNTFKLIEELSEKTGISVNWDKPNAVLPISRSLIAEIGIPPATQYPFVFFKKNDKRFVPGYLKHLSPSTLALVWTVVEALHNKTGVVLSEQKETFTGQIASALGVSLNVSNKQINDCGPYDVAFVEKGGIITELYEKSETGWVKLLNPDPITRVVASTQAPSVLLLGKENLIKHRANHLTSELKKNPLISLSTIVKMHKV